MARKLNFAADTISLFSSRTKQKKIETVLARVARPQTENPESLFTALQDRWSDRPEYGYDAVSSWARATQRSQFLVKLDGMGLAGKRILDVGAGDGMLGVALSAFGHRAFLVDQDDWRHEQAKPLPFHLADCCKALPFDDASFDLVCSYNSFEHFPTPDTVLAEMIRVTKPGGLIHIEFNPLYCSPWGLHAYRMLRMPYPQFLFSESFIIRKLSETGIRDLGKNRSELQFLNRWRVSQFDKLWARPSCTVLSSKHVKDHSELGLILEFPDAFQGLGLTIEDVTVAGISATLLKAN